MKINKLNEDVNAVTDACKMINDLGVKANISNQNSLWVEYPTPIDITELKANLVANGIKLGHSTSVRAGKSGKWEWRSYPEYEVEYCTPSTKRLDAIKKRAVKKAKEDALNKYVKDAVKSYSFPSSLRIARVEDNSTNLYIFLKSTNFVSYPLYNLCIRVGLRTYYRKHIEVAPFITYDAADKSLKDKGNFFNWLLDKYTDISSLSWWREVDVKHLNDDTTAVSIFDMYLPITINSSSTEVEAVVHEFLDDITKAAEEFNKKYIAPLNVPQSLNPDMFEHI